MNREDVPNASQCTFSAPPLPRFRYHHKTGTWRKENVPPNDEATVMTVTLRPYCSDGTIAGASTHAVQAMYAPFESSYDFFLRSVKPPPSRWTQAERDARRREATRIPIRDFEVALLRSHSCTVNGRRLRSLSEVQGWSSAVSEGAHRSKDLRLLTTPAAALHPLVGYASTASMPAVFAALASLKPNPLNFMSALLLEDRINRSEFHEFLSTIGPIDALSTSYEDMMFRALPSYSADTETVEVLAVLTLLLDHHHHPQFELNITAIFRSFDVDERGVVALEVLHPEVISAWANVRTFGKLREQWSRFSAVMAAERRSGAVKFPRIPELVPRNALRAFLCCAEGLYMAACSLDLDGGSL
ncbi:hypothetical protein ABL78_6168 [Leptomonas seymouri]|uniref:Uncharacterized protein n=1 Tax=Leptomonas seymouri TaxID=5684 RepID=A0A0N1I3R6_LEPSE|nr:hypothetical protein ABL78_6168 [Leptomonas seymouri]|eukprot:KPI84785.1 hypothetical protein ABL78_6168 [Leptomonas seymouri]